MLRSEFLHSYFGNPVEALSEFLLWATPNVGLALLQVFLLLLVLWVGNISPKSEQILANSVLLFYSTSLMGTTIYSIRKNSGRLGGYGLTLLLFVSLITAAFYTWGGVVAHDPTVALKPVWAKRLFVEVNVAMLVTIFAFATDLDGKTT
jgi:hypothetical protein